MIKQKYLEQTIQKINEFNKNKNLKFFIYGSSLTQDHFGDIDIGVIGNISDKDLSILKEDFENSNLPYFVDIVHFDKVSKEFKNNVFKNKILWITH